ncbi:putative mediator of RNA polymerase II transcription subunit 26b [Platanthera zijinensis]|uniref:Mediator of RNA polymerase II transcription subunit 26b n=1 Tax=Platanthera zijinensis TaxID=2320716 RepID=A0AAP0FZV9_9ASPA
MEGKSMDYWRRFFRSTEADIFEVIEKAIAVAATDCPKEFRSRRDGIAEKLFSVRVSKCFGCCNVKLLVPDSGEDLRAEEDGGSVKWELIEKGSNIDGGNGGEHDELTRARISNYGYDDEPAEALTEVMDEENRITGEVLRIKELLLHSHDQSEAVLYESLSRLQLMQLSVETLQETEIGRLVNDLRKHNSKRISRLARTLIEGWKAVVDEWVLTAAAIAEHCSISADPALLAEEDGLPIPPMDEGALLATQSTSIQLSEIFDGIDDNGSINFASDLQAPVDTLRPVPEIRESARWSEPPRQPIIARQAKPLSAPVAPPKPQGTVSNFAKPSIAASKPSRPPLRPTYEQKSSDQVFAVQKMPSSIPVDKSKDDEEALLRAKLELAKRKLHEGYEQAENSKRQRTIQIVEFQEPPKQPNSQQGKPNSQQGKPNSQRGKLNSQRGKPNSQREKPKIFPRRLWHYIFFSVVNVFSLFITCVLS